MTPPTDADADDTYEPSTGVELIAQERTRQIRGEGYTREHDASHHQGDLADAAIAYLLTDSRLTVRYWPWDPSSFKPGDRRRDLVKAGALIAAALDAMGDPS